MKPSPNYNRCLHKAVSYGMIDLVKFFISKKCNVNAVQDNLKDPETPLDNAIHCSEIERGFSDKFTDWFLDGMKNFNNPKQKIYIEIINYLKKNGAKR